LTPFSDYSKTIFSYLAGLEATEYDRELCIDLCDLDKLIKNCSCASWITFELLLGKIGGIMDLFIGLNFLTILGVIELAFVATVVLFE
jgi:hypothetical protein